MTAPDSQNPKPTQGLYSARTLRAMLHGVRVNESVFISFTTNDGRELEGRLASIASNKATAYVGNKTLGDIHPSNITQAHVEEG